MYLVYIDILRQVCPMQNQKTDFDFFLFGGFDAMKVSLCEENMELKKIEELKMLHEKRHEVVPEVYDRQPLYLYSP